MKHGMMVLAVVAVVGLAFSAGFAQQLNPGPGPGVGAAPPAPPAPLTAKGTISKVDGDKVTMKVAGRLDKDGKPTEIEVTYVTDAKTEVTLDDKAAKVADLKADQTATVTYTFGGAPGAKPVLTASKIEAKSAAAAKP
jgi:hypothetical protein